MSTSTFLALLLLIGLASSISSVAGLTCWRCDDTNGKPCTGTNEKEVCGPDFLTCVRKYKSKDDKNEYARECSAMTSSECFEPRGVSKGQHWCTCKTDLCNGDSAGKVDEAGQLQSHTNGTGNGENANAKDNSTGGAGGGGDHGRRHSSLLIAGFALLVPLLTHFQ